MASQPPFDRDRLYAQQRHEVHDFVFDDAVAAVFPDMLARSIPGYAAIIGMIELMAAEHAQPRTCLYDLGCSLGAASLALHAGSGDRRCRIIAVDNAPAMLARARRNLSGRGIEWVCSDLREVRIEKASMVVLNFTLQFVPLEQRLKLLQGIRAGLLPGGLLVLSEKVRGETPAADRQLLAMHHAFKRANGYSDLEISQKRTALENVLLPEPISTHKQRLDRAGFAGCDVWFQCFNFVSMVAWV